MKKIKEFIYKVKEYLKGKGIVCIDFDNDINYEMESVKIPTNKSRYRDYKLFLKNDYIRNHLYD